VVVALKDSLTKCWLTKCWLARRSLSLTHSLTLSLMHRKKDIYNKEHEKAAVVGSHQLCSLPSEGSRSVFLDATFGGINL
jgi:hypothetical protein